MAARKQTAKTTADRAEQLKKSTTRAGKGKGNLIQRKVQNAEVKDGTIRVGKSGKSYNVYDAKSGTWKRGVVTAKPMTKSPAKISSSTVKPVTDRLSHPLPHKKGYQSLGAEGNKWIVKKSK